MTDEPQQPTDENEVEDEVVEEKTGAQVEVVPPKLDIPDDAVNLLPILRKAGKKNEKIKAFIDSGFPTQITDDMEEGKNSRAGWLEKTRIRMRLWLGDLEPKSVPWENCANMHDPVMLSRCLRLVARTYGEIFKTGRPIFSAVANSRLTVERAEAATRHENWQFRKEIPDFPKHALRALQAFYRDGEAVFHSYRDMERGVNRHDYLKPDQFVYPYSIDSTATDMSDIPWKIKLLYRDKRQLRKAAKLGYYDAEAVADLIRKSKGTYEDNLDRPVLDQANEYEGVDRSEITRDAPYTLLEYYGWMNIPGSDEDIPVRAVLANENKKLLAIFTRYYDDPADVPRFKKQKSEFDLYMEEMDLYTQTLEREAALMTRLQQPDVNPDDAANMTQTMAAQRPLKPQAPEWMTADGQPPEPIRKKVIEPFTHATCIENPDGSYGLGVGMLLEPHQMAMNIMLNQAIDQGTLANGRPIFKHSSLKLPPGTTTIEPGKIIDVDGVPPDRVQGAMFPIDIPPANPQLFQAVENQRNAVDAVSSAPDVLSGERESEETFRGQASRIEQSAKQNTVFATNFVTALSQIARNNALLNQQFLPSWTTMDLPNPQTDKMEPVQVGRELYANDFDILFTADLEFKSTAAKVAEADDVLGMLTKGVPPQLAVQLIPPTVYLEAIRNCLKVRGMHDMVAMMPTNAEFEAKQAQQQAMGPPPGMPPGGPGGPPQPGRPPAPSIPTGQPNIPPGGAPPQTRVPPSVAPQGAPNRTP